MSGESQESSLLGEFGPTSGLWGFIRSKKNQAVSSSISDWHFKAKDTDYTLGLAVDVRRFAVSQQRGLGRHPRPGMPRANWDPLDLTHLVVEQWSNRIPGAVTSALRGVKNVHHN